MLPLFSCLFLFVVFSLRFPGFGGRLAFPVQPFYRFRASRCLTYLSFLCLSAFSHLTIVEFTSTFTCAVLAIEATFTCSNPPRLMRSAIATPPLLPLHATNTQAISYDRTNTLQYYKSALQGSEFLSALQPHSVSSQRPSKAFQQDSAKLQRFSAHI